jgi:hypothetical protein
MFGFDNLMDASGKPVSGDPEHSFGLFATSASRALLLLREWGRGERLVDAYLPKLTAGVEWFLSPEVQKVMAKKIHTLTHRGWYSAAMMAQMAALTGNTKYNEMADRFAVMALSQYQNGVNPEQNGFDVNYQMVGILFAEHYYILTRNAQLREQTLAMLRNTLATELRHIGQNGVIDTSDSTREGHELTRGGKVKTPDIAAFLEALAEAGDLTGDPQYVDAAQRIVNGPEGHGFSIRKR